MNKKKVTLYNVKPFNVFVDLDGNEDTDDIIILGKGGKQTVELSNDRIEQLRKELAGQVVIK
jgi:2-phospho-L-lactate guanylyltransferase (CobY/MobA/RfbA family)